MKQLSLSALLLAGLASCKSGSDPAPAPVIVGKWENVRSQDFSVYTDGTLGPMYVDTSPDSVLEEYTTAGKWRLRMKAGKVKSLDYDYTLVGDSLRLVDNRVSPSGKSLPYYVQKLTSDSLVITYSIPSSNRPGVAGRTYCENRYLRWKR